MPLGSRVRVASIAVVACVEACSLTDLSGFTTPASNDGVTARDGAAAGDGGAATTADGGAEASATSAYAALVRADKPVAYFRFDEDATAGALTDDITGQTVPTTAHVKPGAAGVSGHGLSLDGDGDLNLGDVFDFAGLVPFSLEVWVSSKPRRGLDQHLFNKRVEASGPMLGYVVYLGEDLGAHFEGWGTNLSAWTDTPIPSTFTHLVVSVAYDATGRGNATLWVNGAQAPEGGSDNTEALANTTVPLRIGRGVVGEIDELAIYDHALSASRVAAHFAAGKP